MVETRGKLDFKVNRLVVASSRQQVIGLGSESHESKRRV